MPTCFQFRNQRGESIPLVRIDEELCVAFGEEIDPDCFSPITEELVCAALTILAKARCHVMTATLLEEFCKDPVLKRFLVDDYVFTAWYHFED